MIHLNFLLAQAAEKAAETTETVTPATEGSGLSMFMSLLIVFAYLFLPFIIGYLAEKALKLKDVATRIGVVLFALGIGMSPFISQWANDKPLSGAFNPGIDLAGGMNMVFEVDVEKAEEQGKEVNSKTMDQMVGAIARRLDPSGTKNVTVRRRGAHKIEIIIPEIDPNEVKIMADRVQRLGSLEFGILATNRNDKRTIDQVNAKLSDDDNNLIVNGILEAGWRTVSFKDGEQLEVSKHSDVVTREVDRVVTDEEGNEVKQKVEQFLVVFEKPNKRVTGEFLTRVSPTTDPASGSLAVSFSFNSRGAHRFQLLTTKHRPDKDDFKRRLAILLDDQVHSAPQINDVISSNGQITGNFSRDEVDELVNVLNAGALQVPLKDNPRSNIVDPTLGATVVEKGKVAIIVGALSVVFFMLIYYRFSGLVANICLFVNLILVLGTMAFIDATFTLPGLAGIVLTIGMAVDANVLIFERMREERQRGSSLRMAIQNGFDRAFTTIVDANLTTLITAVVLYIIGTDQVRGFAVTLFIGIIMSMFTALYFGRLIFEIFERKRWISDLKMMSMVKENVKFDFIGKKKIAAAASVLVIGVGLASIFTRGTENLDIDFTGGIMVSFEFEENQDLEKVRAPLTEEFGSAITLERLRFIDQSGADNVRRFRLRTRDTDPEVVRQKVNDAFKDSEMELQYVTMDASPIEEVQTEATEEVPETELKAYEFDVSFKTKVNQEEQVKEVPLQTVSAYFAEELAKIGRSEDNPEALGTYGSEKDISGRVGVEGTEGSGLTFQKGMTKQFSKFTVDIDPDIAKSDVQAAIDNIQNKLSSEPYFPEVDTFDTSIAGEMKEQAALAMIFSLLAIIGYIWFRFQRISFGFAAVVALLHDVLVVVGMVALASLLSNTPLKDVLLLEDFKINLPMIAAFLTIVGYSLNDTIVVFDRIREVRGKNPALTEEMVNISLNQTLARTLLTSLTTLLVVAVLYVMGGEGIHGFAFCLVLGVMVGTYSSIYVASPVLLWLMNRPGSQPASRAAVSTAAKPTAT